MPSTHPSGGATAMRTPAYLATPDRDYLWIPTQLLDQLYDSPLAIGLYTLIARRWLADGGPDGVPISDADIARYDPQLSSRGALLRAQARLEEGGWATVVRTQGSKTRYIPAWGWVRGGLRCWSKDAPSLNRGRVQTLRVSRLLLDDYLGRMIPHPKAPALIERYQTTATISLKDIGVYILRQRHRTTVEAPALEAAFLCHADEALAVPPTEDTLARAELSQQGMQRVGLLPPGPIPRPGSTDARPPIFFVAPNMIGHMIGHMIGYHTALEDASMSLQRDETQVEGDIVNVTGIKGIKGMINPPTPFDSQTGGGQELFPDYQENEPERRSSMDTTEGQPTQTSIRPRRERTIMSIPTTPSAERLVDLGVRPAQCVELANEPLETIAAAIADGQSRPKVHDLAAWVVSMVRDVRDHGWDLALRKRGPAPDNAGPSLAQLQASIAEAKASGTWVTDGATDTAPAALPVPPVTDDTAALLRHAKASGFFGSDDAPPVLSPPALQSAAQGCAASVDATAPTPAQPLPPTPGAVLEPPPAQGGDDPARPAWIAAQRWQSLPVLVRGMLRGSQLTDRTITAADSWRQKQLDRYQAELSGVIAAAVIERSRQNGADHDRNVSIAVRHPSTGFTGY